MIALGSLAAAGLALATLDRRAPALAARPVGQRPTLMLLTTLPLVFGEGFGLGSGGSLALTRLETRYHVQPIAVADRANLGRAHLLFAAHPLAQPAEVLVELDRWVRGGGRLLLLADPALDWHSDRPLGDRFRPPGAFADTGLLAHWSIRLDAPDSRGPVERIVDGYRLKLGSPGTLVGRCPIGGSGLIARCTIGRGRVTIIADADLLDDRGVAGAAESANLDWLVAELAALEPR